MIALRTFAIALLLPLQAKACLWVDGTTLDGKKGSIEPGYPADALRKSLETDPADGFYQLMQNRRHAENDDFTTLEIKGLEKVFDGNPAEAIAIFNEIEAAHPGRYSTAVNMGTAYELQGDLDQALRWITEGIRRNPESHFGTEWLHVEILKARIELKKDPTYLRKHPIIALPDPLLRSSKIGIGGRSYGMIEIADAIGYQLRERMIFVKPPDPVVADLLFTFGEIESHTRIVESGIRLLQLAKDFGHPDSARLTAKIERYEQVRRDRVQMLRVQKIGWTVGIVLVVAAFLLFLILAWRRRWFFLSRAAYLKHRQETN